MQNKKYNQNNFTNFVEKMEKSQIDPSIFVAKIFSFPIPYHFTSYLQHCL